MGARGGGPRRRRNPADVDRSRRHARRVRLRADRGGRRPPCRSRSSRPAAPARSSISTRSSRPAAPTRRSPRRSFISPSTRSPSSRRILRDRGIPGEAVIGMLIPSIDLQGGQHRPARAGRAARASRPTTSTAGSRSSRGFPKVQLIDLDAAKNTGDNRALVASICARLPCRVGGGIRTVDRAAAALGAGARKVIVGSALFRGGRARPRVRRGAGGAVRRRPADRRRRRPRRTGRRSTAGARSLPITPVEAIHALEPFFGEFLFTNVDVEGLMQGIDRDAIAAVRDATTRDVTAAGGVTTQEEIDWLAASGSTPSPAWRSTRDGFEAIPGTSG